MTQAFNLSQLANNLNTSGQLDATDGLYGAVPIANGGTGATSAATAFANIKQNASDTATGVVELATSAEAIAGTSTSVVLTPATLRNGLNASGFAPVYAARAWVNFDGTGTIAIRSSGNVSSLTDNGTGDYTITFSTAMQDANYAPSGMASNSNNFIGIDNESAVPTTTTLRIQVTDGGNTPQDGVYVCVSIHR